MTEHISCQELVDLVTDYLVGQKLPSRCTDPAGNVLAVISSEQAARASIDWQSRPRR